MSNEPADTGPTHDEFIPDPDEVEYPSTLRTTSLPAKQAQAAALERAERQKQGEEVSHVVNFEDRMQPRQLLVNRRMEPPGEVMERPPESIRVLTSRLERDVHDVHDDLHLLVEYGIIHFEKDGRVKKPYVPYDTTQIEVKFGLPRDEGSSSPAPAQSEIRGYDFPEPVETFLALPVVRRRWDADY